MINQVITLTGNVTTTSGVVNYNNLVKMPNSITVPAGKVWKVESIYATRSNSWGHCSNTSEVGILRDNQKITISIINNEFIMYNPLWIAQNSELSIYPNFSTSCTNTTLSGGQINVFFSIIEYNIIP